MNKTISLVREMIEGVLRRGHVLEFVEDGWERVWVWVGARC